MIDLSAIKAFVTALTGNDQTVMDWRCINDTDKGAPAIPLRGTADQVATMLDTYNASGYGVFVMINQTDGQGRERANVNAIRAHFIDYDGADSQWSQFHNVGRWSVTPSFYVIGAIPGKFHAYWLVDPYNDNARFELIQRKLVTHWQSDKAPIDPPRVMRVPGTAHMKNPQAPVMVTMVPGSKAQVALATLEGALQGVTVDGGGAIERKDLDDDTTKAPSLEWAVYALDKIDPGSLGRDEWVKITAAFKSASYVEGDGGKARAAFDAWCARYPDNDLAENEKLWSSIRDTKTGWAYLERVSGVKIERMFGQVPVVLPDGVSPVPVAGKAKRKAVAKADDTATSEPDAVDPFGDHLTPTDQIKYFAGCWLITSQGKILVPEGRFMDAGKFNSRYGGKLFVISNDGKVTDEAWKAATRGLVYKVPMVDHVRFLPTEPINAIIKDELGRKAVNTYRPAIIRTVKGDPSPFIRHIQAMLPTERDAEIYFSALRHTVQRPGRKMFWAPLIQSTEGAGKGFIKLVMTHALGSLYVHAPNAKELIESGGKFTGWMREKLLIIADEIRVDEKRDMIEVLKPMITEDRIEIQGKGADQVMDDNVANWLFFTNWRDAIPVGRNDRRYSIFFSTLQGVDDIERLGMGGDYFPRMYAWLKADGAAIVTDWLQRSAITAEFDPLGAAHRAPVTSSSEEAVIEGRGRIENLIATAAADGSKGFRNGWVSSVMLGELLKAEGIRYNNHMLNKAFIALGYHHIGRANSAYFDEGMKQPNLHNLNKMANVGDYPSDQGYLGAVKR